MPLPLQQLLEFTTFFHKFQRIVRTIYVNGEDRKENDAEHSYQLALTAWFIANTRNLNLDKDRLIKYSLIHDLAEVYAGDPYFVSNEPNKDQIKKEREREAVEQMKSEFPGFTDFFELIEKYEAKSDEESKFVYALDKVLPMINELLNNGRSMKEYKLTLEEMIRGQEKKISISPEVKYYYDVILEIFKEKEEHIFYIPGK